LQIPNKNRLLAEAWEENCRSALPALGETGEKKIWKKSMPECRPGLKRHGRPYRIVTAEEVIRALGQCWQG
jgi:hypothetical protein